MAIKAAVVGATGYAGAELVRILAGHPETELAILTSRQYKGVRFDAVYPSMAGIVDAVCQPMETAAICENADVIFTALPHKIPMTHVPEYLRRGKKVVDLSADFRFSDPDVYEVHYQPHTARNLLGEAVFGLCELYADRIRNARLIGNPGCYPTSILLPLVPLLRAGILEVDSLIADAKSGVSGAGRSPALGTLFCEVHESFKAYKIAEHRHNPEVDEILTREAGGPVHLTFVPHLVPMGRGMLTTLYARPSQGVKLADVQDCLDKAYGSQPFVRLCKDGRMPETRHVRGTNFCDIGIRMDESANRLIVISAIDNLVKGAAGQAVQNMNLMFGLNETAGLLNVPYPV